MLLGKKRAPGTSRHESLQVPRRPRHFAWFRAASHRSHPNTSTISFFCSTLPEGAHAATHAMPTALPLAIPFGFSSPISWIYVPLLHAATGLSLSNFGTVTGVQTHVRRFALGVAASPPVLVGRLAVNLGALGLD